MTDSAKGTAGGGVAVTGASGLVGRALRSRLEADGVRVVRLVRKRGAGPDTALWDPAAGTIDAGALEGLDAVVHLAAENIGDGRWTSERKDRILRSRVDGTRLVAKTLASLERPPRVLVSASAVGWYGDRGDETLDETAAPGTGFLADVCEAWEAETEPASRAGIRVARIRSGVVLSGEGGALAKMLPAFRFGLGGRSGSGRQWVSWISRTDLVEAIRHLIATEDLEGPVNTVAPNPVTNGEMARALGRVLRRPAVIPQPRFALRAMFGEMARVLLDGARVVPAKLLASGFRFRHPDFEAALRAELGGI